VAQRRTGFRGEARIEEVTAPMPPLSGIRVLDFSTLLPGPLATLLLAEAGATVVKVERPDGGDRIRASRPQRDGESIQFALLNRGKKSISVDLKDPAGIARVKRLAAEADVLVEQFRPGVMARLGLGYEDLRPLNPRLIYCSISGFGQDGPLARVAGHDLTYLARCGMLALGADESGRPVLPPGQIADIGGGSYPAVLNILLALLQRDRTGEGCRLDVAMTENLLAWMARPLAMVLAGEGPPAPGRGRHTGGTPRYGIYHAADGEAFAVAALEDRFWRRFCALIGLEPQLHDDERDPQATRAGVRHCFAGRTAADWERLFAGEDVCVERVRDLAAALEDPHFAARRVLEASVFLPGGARLPALPLPLAPAFRQQGAGRAPALGESTDSALFNFPQTGGDSHVHEH
jgi:crotonobetainyl-CoA:carnitine CoA-transferase CaiB-like acyl-CoA transferase